MDTKTEKRTNVWLEVVGWYGAAAILGAYALVSFEVLANDSVSFQILNLTGSLGLLSVSWRKRATQPAALNLAWAVVALVSLVRLAVG